MRLAEAAAHLEIAQSYAATAPPDRRHRLDMALKSLELLLARLRGNYDGVYEQVETLSSPVTGQSSTSVALSSDLVRGPHESRRRRGVVLRLADSERHLLEGATLAHDIGRPYLKWPASPTSATPSPSTPSPWLANAANRP